MSKIRSRLLSAVVKALSWPLPVCLAPELLCWSGWAIPAFLWPLADSDLITATSRADTDPESE